MSPCIVAWNTREARWAVLPMGIRLKGHAYAKTLDNDLANHIIEFSTKMDASNQSLLLT